MRVSAGWLGCSAYCTSLLLVSLLVQQTGLGLWQGVVIAGTLSLLAAGGAALLLPRGWRPLPPSQLWPILGAIGLIAALNYGWQYPTPSSLDISHLIPEQATIGAQQEVWGRINAMPRLTRSGKGQFWLSPDLVRHFDSDKIPLGPPTITQGTLYVTVPAEAIQDLYPGQRVKVHGQLYAPTGPKNPNAFNFQQYLANNDCYAGLRGKWVEPEQKDPPPRWRLWQLRRRIIQAHAVGLGDQAGALVSAMALDRRAVNLPYDLQDTFIQAGLAHTLAASGFHVSLLLGVVLGIISHPAIAAQVTNPGKAKLAIGGSTLLVYVLLTGGQPSIMRAALMGLGALIGIALERRVQPLGCLLLAATLLLLWNPAWIDDIGFRLSVMATLGLMVGVKPFTERLEWLPTTFTTVVAVPLVAYFWTIPLSLYYFNTLTTYSILLNMVVTPVVSLISLGGIGSGLVAVFSPGIASVLAWLLWLPTHLLIWLVNWEASLPGSALATGHISLLQMFSLYALYWLGGWHRWWLKRRWLMALLLVVVAFGPLWLRSATLAEVTVLSAGNDAVMLVQDRGTTLLINSGTDKTAFYTTAPFLRQAGINRLAYAVAAADSDRNNWQTITAKAPVNNLYSAISMDDPPDRVHHYVTLGPGQPITMGHHTIELLSEDAKTLRLTLFQAHTWLLLSGETVAEQKRLTQTRSIHLQSEVLWWDGRALSKELIAMARPQVAIASSRQLDPQSVNLLREQGAQVFHTELDGAVTWRPKQGYTAYLEALPAADRSSWE